MAMKTCSIIILLMHFEQERKEFEKNIQHIERNICARCAFIVQFEMKEILLARPMKVYN